MADQYDELFVPHVHGYEAMHTMILTMLPFTAEDAPRVLELGIGTGNLTQRCLQQWPHATLVGYDLSAEMLQRAQEKLAPFRARLHIYAGDISQTTFAGPFDAVISAIAVHHVPPRLKPILFHRLYAALRPGGVLVLGDAFQAATPALELKYRRMVTAEWQQSGLDMAAYNTYRSLSRNSGGASTTVAAYLRWMRQAGLTNVECVWKYFSRGVVYGERPVEA
jgi:tRNA (cmo5U34)-methyltransferase